MGKPAGRYYHGGYAGGWTGGGAVPMPLGERDPWCGLPLSALGEPSLGPAAFVSVAHARCHPRAFTSGEARQSLGRARAREIGQRRPAGQRHAPPRVSDEHSTRLVSPRRGPATALHPLSSTRPGRARPATAFTQFARWRHALRPKHRILRACQTVAAVPVCRQVARVPSASTSLPTDAGQCPAPARQTGAVNLRYYGETGGTSGRRRDHDGGT